jgi:NTE family protein
LLGQKSLNLALGGGGVKGIAYVGMLNISQQRGYTWKNIAGVSVGALMGSFIAAGYKYEELKSLMDSFNIANLSAGKINDSHPVISRYIQYYNGIYPCGRQWTQNFLTHRHFSSYRYMDDQVTDSRLSPANRNLIENIINFSNEGNVANGDYLEEWISEALKNKGIKTFEDTKNGCADNINPNGYSIRMTAVDLSRWKVITIPDDLAYYGVNPDKFEVAKAVRMSTSVPFIFKPVEITRAYGEKTRVHYIVDGGVLDNFPIWLVDKDAGAYTVGFKLNKGNGKLFSLDVPLNILRALVSAIHQTGIPDYMYNPGSVKGIDASKVSSFNFELSENDREYLIDCGAGSAENFFDKFENKKFN